MMMGLPFQVGAWWASTSSSSSLPPGDHYSVLVVFFSTSLALVGGSAFLLLVYLYTPYWGLRKVPGPPTTPLLGHLPLLARYGPDVFTILANKYGPIYRFHMGRQPLVIVAEPELCREVGIKKFKSIGNRSLPSPISGSPLHRKGLFFTRDSRWSAMRNTITSFYQPSHLARLIPTMHSFIHTAFHDLPTTHSSDEDVDIVFSELSLKLATDVIGQAAFGVDFGLISSKQLSSSSAVVSAFVKQHIFSTTSLKMDLSGSFSIILGLLLPILQEPFRHILRNIPGTADRKIDRTNKSLSRRVDDIVQKRAREIKVRGGGGGASRDFLSAILSTTAGESTTAADGGVTSRAELFTGDYISALTYEHLLAGSATTSFTLSSVLYLVAGHPEVEKKLVDEIDAFGSHDRVPSADELHRSFPYLDQVIKEAMRFYTVSPLIAREASQPVEVGGYLLPKGTWIWLAPGVLAKDPKHFPEPHIFRPERFDPNGEEEKRRHPYAHIPFGIGPRACIGQKFSLQEIKLSLIYLYRRFTFTHSPNMESPLAFDYGIVLNFKHGVKLQATKRSTATD